MLLEKQKDTPYIGIFKLSTGEEIITQVISYTPTDYTIKNPLCMVATAQGYQFAPVLIMAEPGKPIELDKSLTVMRGFPGIELEGQYESALSGIALPKKSSIIT